MRPLSSRVLLPEPVLEPRKAPYQPLLHRHFNHALSPLHHSHSHHQQQLSTPKRSVTPQASSSRCHIFWDLDNLQPTQVEDIPVIVHAINCALLDLISQLASPSLQELPPPPPQLQLTVFANPTTLQKFSPLNTENATSFLSSETTSSSSSSSLDLRQAVEDVLGGTLILTTERKQSVDFAMKSAMLEYAQQANKKIISPPPETTVSTRSCDLIVSENLMKQKETGAEIVIIACISDDTDYVQVLEYLGKESRSSSPLITTRLISASPVAVACRTVSIGEFKRRKRPAWAAPRKLDSFALPAACDAAIALSRPRKNSLLKARDTRNISANRRGRGGGGEGATEEEGTWRVETVWVNPKRNWKERIEITD
ncbi:hypothetical protein Ndes2526B_g00698 [Nannochloris sp. 'desiccata']|nr:hypothetical protein NADE_003851 [Chlorella desiccata (nom. nud.)]